MSIAGKSPAYRKRSKCTGPVRSENVWCAGDEQGDSHGCRKGPREDGRKCDQRSNCREWHMMEGASYGATGRLVGRRGTFTVKEMGAAAGRTVGSDFKTLLTVT